MHKDKRRSKEHHRRNHHRRAGPTDASALIPRNLPTMAASASEYVCCSRLPSNKGIVKLKISGRAHPAVISLDVAINLIPLENLNAKIEVIF